MDCPSERERPGNGSTAHATVLLVEDSRFDQKLIGKAILDLCADLDLHTAVSIADARQKVMDLEPEGFTIAFLDRHLPDGDGLDLLGSLTECGTPMVVFCDQAEMTLSGAPELPALAIPFSKESTTSNSAMAEVLTRLVQQCSNDPGAASRAHLLPHLAQIADLLGLPGLCNGIAGSDTPDLPAQHRSPA